MPATSEAGGAPGASPLVAAAAELAAAFREPASRWDAEGRVPPEALRTLAATGLLAADLPSQHGGRGLTPAELGEVTAHLGGVCSALRGLLTVQSMVAAALLRWGTRAQRADWLPGLADGTLIAGFAATEDGAGSALGEVATTIEDDGDGLRVTGRKKWVTFGESADVLLVLGRHPDGLTTVLVETTRSGVRTEPVTGQLGMRAAGIAHVTLDGVRIPAGHRIAPPGTGLSHVAASALDHGRYTVAWGCVGMAEACVADAAAHAAARLQGGLPLGRHQSVGALLARSAVSAAAARELAALAGRARTRGPGRGITETIMAKYAAAGAAAETARAAVQVLGAAGIAPDSRAGRHYRDAKVMEIIEGAQEVAESHLAEQLLRRHGAVA
ncbi:acyl-CoA/acyl-ACP dehydrogenase [Streptomyces sp. OfavH-34-F]|uniref:acyl-CoA dehydrogenase family protein n=1 Tax=Streptomyces sp. OfavH-34-F TaxID=2917760 RepID=UPI001EF2FA0B|nr:acyl-CoA dehydrogenase family protein [Streptomyces sp. OfavH-34-F]MCG7526555.1 acyl-CoA/acyl-ACP dehydrogenase [Streptomyces sp. OfavH-34-F]